MIASSGDFKNEGKVEQAWPPIVPVVLALIYIAIAVLYYNQFF